MAKGLTVLGVRPIAFMVLIIAAAIALMISAPPTSSDGGDDIDGIPSKSQLAYATLGSQLNQAVAMVEGGLFSEQEAAALSPIHSNESVAVTVYLSSNVAEVVQFLEDNGGDPRNVGVDYIEAYVPVSLLGELSQQPGVTRVQEIIPPEPAYGNVTSQAVSLHQAVSWQNADLRGEGVKVGIIDTGFTGYSHLMGVELPANVVARCYTDMGVFSSNLADCETEEEPPASTPDQCQDYVAGLYEGGDPHGTAVAEAVIDIAPGATLYIANPSSRGDLQETAEWMADQGVKVINYSVGWIFDGPGDGTSPFSSSPLNAVDQAVARDITWVNAAGNSAGDTWFGSFSDPDDNGFINFSNFGVEINSIVLSECRRYLFQLRWEDNWGGAATDLDMYLWDKSTGDILDIPAEWGYIGSAVEQSGASSHYPWELFFLRSPIDSEDVGVIIVHAGGPEPEWIHLELFSGPGGLEYSTDVSITNPAESANPGMLAVGAAPFNDINTIEPFSSRGPTPDGRIKPDIVGVDCAASVSYERRNRRDNGEECWFAGTSQASPHVAGLAALVRQRFPEFSAEQTADYLKNNAEQREFPDPNNTWGYGFAVLPEIETSSEATDSIAVGGTDEGTWAPGCSSQERSGSHARYYTLNLEEAAEVTIELTSDDADTYLYLRPGEAITGDFLYENDDIESGNTNSRIVATLSAGTYTIEATTYSAGVTGTFTLAVTGPSGTTTPGTDECSETLTGDGSTTGTWAEPCESDAREGRYARYYTFTLDQQSAVTIDLESDVDTYLYLRSGDARSGATVDGGENDDIQSGNTNSRITATLAAGTYTIEATTYNPGETGTFTLTVSGLDGTTTPGTGDCDTVTITDDGERSGQWAAGCESSVAARGYARYYTFEVEEATQVTITLESNDADTYLYLREGAARSGTVLHENDDHDGSLSVSQITATLPANTYTIEATTYAEGETGNFTLTVSGLDGTTTPVTGDCSVTLTDDATVSGTWAEGCDSSVSDRGHARYYTFEVEEATQVTITLESNDADTYLYLREGAARSGTVLHENDDHDGSLSVSQITATLPANTYTIEATTYSAGETGTFTLTVSGLDGTTTPGTGECSETLTADGTVSGTWAAGCDSSVSGRGHARYYTFTLDQQSEVTIDLESEVDTYLYLREEEATSGTAQHEDDDGGDGTNSRIVATLAAGTYTIEATTYSTGVTGNFTLTVSGLEAAVTIDLTSSVDTYLYLRSGADTLTGNGTVSDTWAAGCDSSVSDRGHARYYTFTLDEEAAVTIDLTSSVDTYLYLRSGGRGDHRGRTAPERRHYVGQQHQLPDRRHPRRRHLHHRGHHLPRGPDRQLHPHRHRPGHFRLNAGRS